MMGIATVSRCLGLALLLLIGVAEALDIESQYSPLNRKRGQRTATRFIILHTTEGAAKGSLAKLRKYGEAHYLVDRDGKVTRIIHRDRIAMHAGRSMWNVATDLDKVSIGIEVVGYHNKPLTAAQIAALKELLRQLQAIYQVPDQRVLPHSMVAYGRPNRWHPHSHRGRKRCAMLMAQTSLRRQLGLTDKPAYDPDVRAGRLRVADPYLERILYGPDTARPEAVSGGSNVIAKGRSAWDIAREKYNAASTVYTFPGGKVMRGNEITQWNAMPSGTRVTVDASDGEGSGDAERVQVIGRDGASAQTIAGEEWNRSTTLYFLANQRVLQGDQLQASDVSRLVAGTRMLVGYTHGGRIAAKRSAFDICGPRWNLPSTFYRLPDGRLLHGGEIDERGIPNGTLVFFQQ